MVRERWAFVVYRIDSRSSRTVFSTGFLSAASEDEAVGVALRKSAESLSSGGSWPVQLVRAWKDEAND